MNMQSVICSKFHAIPKNLSFKNVQVSLIWNIKKNYSTSTSEEIIIPQKISRGPTDILRALESTVGRDVTATHYKFHDDPFLIPKSNISKRSLAMAQEAGRKAAHWVRKENIDLFQHREAEPFIELFGPPKIYTKDSEVTVDDLKKCIEDTNVSDCILIYKLLKEKSIDIEPEVFQSLLELLCFYNSEDALNQEFIEERWFRQSSKGTEKQRKSWKDGAFAEEIFISIKEPTAMTYSTIIQGMVKYYQIERATQLFEEAKQKGFVLNANTYNAMIEASNLLKENYEMRWSYIIQLLNEMKENKVKPNLGTLNSVLYCLSGMGYKAARENVLKVLSEFKKLNIEPSLASWNCVLQIYCKDKGPTSTVLIDILNEIENKEHEIRDLRDINFFLTAMAVCRFHLNDFNVAKRVDALLHFGRNYDLIGDSFKESVYYRHYFLLALSNLPFNDFMENIYEKLVPHIYTPEMSVLEETLKQINALGNVEYLPKLWSDIITFDAAKRESMFNCVIDTMVDNEPIGKPDLQEKFTNIASDVYERLMNQNENRSNQIPITADILGSIMVLFLRNKLFDKAWEVFTNLEKNHQKILGVPKFEALSALVDGCIEQKSPSNAMTCIQFGVDSGYENIDKLAKKIQTKLTLDETHLQKLSNIAGQHVIISTKDINQTNDQ